jgi:Leucine-rich repeat (LRR) protein
MSLNRTLIFGLATSRLLNDVQDKTQSLRALGINKPDLDVIQGSRESGVINADLVAVAGLNTNIYPFLDRYSNNIVVASNRFGGLVGDDSPTMSGNFTVNGQLAASGVTYKIFDESADEKFVNASISTAVNSAWSFFDFEFTNQTEIYYGNSLRVNNKLVAPTLGSQMVTAKRFSAEIPTHMVQMQVGDQIYGVYAQAASPLSFEGIFKNFTGSFARNNLRPGLYPSWRISQADQILLQNEDVIPPRVEINFVSATTDRRTLQLYYPADAISEIDISSLGTTVWPPAQLINLLRLNLQSNLLFELPAFAQLAPSLQVLNISNNRFFLSTNPQLRKLGVQAAQQLPTSLTELYAVNSFTGSLTDVVDGVVTSVLDRFSNLRVVHLGSNSLLRSERIAVDEQDTVGYFPDVAQDNTDPINPVIRIRDYRITETRLRDLSKLINLSNAPELAILNLRGNSNAGRADNMGNLVDIQLASTMLRSVDVTRTRINILNLQNKRNLVSYSGFGVNQFAEAHSLYNSSSPTQNNQYKFFNCSNLLTLNLSNSNYTGFIPRFEGNLSLTTLSMANTRFTGGRPGVVISQITQGVSNSFRFLVQNTAGIQVNMMVSGTGVAPNTRVLAINGNEIVVDRGVTLNMNTSVTFGTFVLFDDTFSDCLNLVNFDFSSPFMYSFEIQPNTFNLLGRLRFLRISSSGRLGGTIPNLNNCRQLRILNLSNNALLGQAPSLVNNNLISAVELSNNQLSGSLPEFPTLNNLNFLSLVNNQIDSFAQRNGISVLGNLPRLFRLRLQFNKIQGSLPNLSTQCFRLRQLEIQHNLLNTYVPGSLVGLNQLTLINMSSNRLSQSDVDSIILDVDTSVSNFPRRGFLNLTGDQQAAPSSDVNVRSAMGRLITSGWTVLTN